MKTRKLAEEIISQLRHVDFEVPRLKKIGFWFLGWYEADLIDNNQVVGSIAVSNNGWTIWRECLNEKIKTLETELKNKGVTITIFSKNYTSDQSASPSFKQSHEERKKPPDKQSREEKKSLDYTPLVNKSLMNKLWNGL